jgi:membrane-associated phospholipid phosphatase
MPAVVMVAMFYYDNFYNALFVSAFIVFGVVAPLAIRNYKKARAKVYTNFDVSDQQQRNSWFKFAVGLFCLAVIVMLVTPQDPKTRYSFLIAAGLLLASQLLNYYVKSSMHVSVNVFLGFMILTINPLAAIAMFLLILPVAWSRLYLKRHTVAEVIAGGILGLTFGLLLYYMMQIDFK